MLSKHIQIRSSNMFQRSKRIARDFSAGGVFYNSNMIKFLWFISLLRIRIFSFFFWKWAQKRSETLTNARKTSKNM